MRPVIGPLAGRGITAGGVRREGVLLSVRTLMTRLTLAALAFSAVPSLAQKADTTKDKAELKKSIPVFWVDPGDIRSKNLFHGPGGKEGQPKPPFKYLKEDKGGTSPKFEVEDANGEKWKAKLGTESQPETAASRLLWAVGFAANKNYLVPEATVPGVAAKQKRGKKLIGADDRVTNVRMQMKPDHLKKVRDWNWRDKRNRGRHDFNGLRVMMAVLSNWDLKGENNAIFEDETGKKIYAVSDVGASFGTSGRSYNDEITKNNSRAFSTHKFITKKTKNYVDFNFPTHPSLVHLAMFEWVWYYQQMRNHWIGRHIPTEDAQWVGSLLGQLTPQQIRDAFRAAHYPPEEVERLAKALEDRIAQLQKL
jgi:hypothetical protein